MSRVGGSSTLERPLTSAPRAASAVTTAAWFSAAAHISAVCPCHCSFARTSAPASSSRFTAATLPERAASISGVSPSGPAASARAPAFSSASTIGAWPLTPPAAAASRRSGSPCSAWRPARSRQRDQFGVARARRPVQRRRAVHLGRVDVGALPDQRPHRRRVAAPRRLRDARIRRAGSADERGSDIRVPREPRMRDPACSSSGPPVPCCIPRDLAFDPELVHDARAAGSRSDRARAP